MNYAARTPLLLAACALATLSACTTEPRVTINTTPAVVAAPPQTMAVITPAPIVAPAPVITPAPTVILGGPAAFTAIDRDFAQRAAVANMLEMGTARIAPRRTGSADVIAYAAMLDSHHTLALNELTAIMRARGVEVPSSLPFNRQGVMDRISMTRGHDFDRAFITEVGVRAHTDTILMFQQQMPTLSDPDLRNWAARNLPVMQQHLSEAQRISAAIG
jgi:putative membrane protein